MTLNYRAAILTVAWLGLIYWLSSLPDLSTVEDAPIFRIVSNLMHVPIFALLAFCCLKTIVTPHSSWKAYAVAAAITASYAVIDELHQSFVPGRVGSVVDVLIDLASAWGLLLLLWWRTLNHRIQSDSEAGTARTWAN